MPPRRLGALVTNLRLRVPSNDESLLTSEYLRLSSRIPIYKKDEGPRRPRAASDRMSVGDVDSQNIV